MSSSNAPAAAGVTTRPVRWPWTDRLLLLGLVAASALVWAFGVTDLQPVSEPTGPDAFGENNTYWARELRWAALIGLAVVLVVAVRGGRRATAAVLVAGGGWLAADIVVDRFDPVSGVALPALAAALLCGAAALTVPAAARRDGTAAGAVHAVPGRAVTFAAALVAAAAAGLVTLTESPTDVEPELMLGSALTGSLLALIAVAAGTHAAGVISRRRALVAVPAGVLAASVPWLLRYSSAQPTTGRTLGTVAFTVALVVVVVLLTGHGPRLGNRVQDAAVVAAITVFALPGILLPFALASAVLSVGGVFTALAGNPAVHDADSDFVGIVLAIPIGLILHLLLRGFIRGRPE
ncbi:hypothetical protein AMIS_44590 [Actinoplanes missouriensis 431]|uniref:Uncharacterized protein n=1 Tax=Actinoplanes missouriensis (strain ATCC 14538 / DSM 43046 / CBS 188.64 / JCM 3121 / NBRC 102363 / NCIMB 12654 / NRRL B-3342 / UNCC 431) TaxID=512565 RepID=I0H9J2_ACTM4|nr:hypothetical protein [Actinoplanes missouriensis]BAL89679.1 hypothetical protein AMIS_44590 [Actinoplanes missouriensis 431]